MRVTRDEQKHIIEFITRVSHGEHPPMDVEADAIVRALFVRNPDAAYRMTMLAMALAAAPPPPVAQAAPVASRKPLISTLFGRRPGRRQAAIEG